MNVKYQCSNCGKLYENYEQAEQCCISETSNINVYEIKKSFNNNMDIYKKEISYSDLIGRYIITKVTIQKNKILLDKLAANENLDEEYFEMCDILNNLEENLFLFKKDMFIVTKSVIKEFISKEYNFDNKTYKLNYDDVILTLIEESETNSLHNIEICVDEVK